MWNARHAVLGSLVVVGVVASACSKGVDDGNPDQDAAVPIVPPRDSGHDGATLSDAAFVDGEASGDDGAPPGDDGSADVTVDSGFDGALPDASDASVCPTDPADGGPNILQVQPTPAN